MNIREREDALFESWIKKHPATKFIKDGCPQPDVYSAETRKVVFVLKDANMDPKYPGQCYDQRTELELTPHPWWETIATWGYFLQNPSATWNDSRYIGDPESLRQVLSRYCIVQLKKEWGGGSVSNQVLLNAAKEDQFEIVSQLEIYSPHFLVACGNGEQLLEIVGSTDSTRYETSRGVGYWLVTINNHKCWLVDYCHPSARVGTKIKGLVAMGLSAAIQEIDSQKQPA